LSLQQGELYRGAKPSYFTSERLLNAQGLHLQNSFWKRLSKHEATLELVPVTPKTQRWLMEKKKKGNTKAQALTESEKAERTEKSMARATDRAKPNEPQTSSAQITFPTGQGSQ